MKTSWETGTDVTRRVGLLIAAFACLSGTASAESDYLLYAPRPVESSQPPADPGEGVLVQAIIIRQGETLKTISKRYSGRSSYFPQILLFNRIANPDLIHTGDRLLVPLGKGTVAAREEHGKAAAKPKQKKLATAAISTKPVTPLVPATAMRAQSLYEQGKKAYRKGNYRQAETIFSDFLSSYPSSPLAADASYYRADCYLKLSGRK